MSLLAALLFLPLLGALIAGAGLARRLVEDQLAHKEKPVSDGMSHL